jgi:hypothetical protein
MDRLTSASRLSLLRVALLASLAGGWLAVAPTAASQTLRTATGKAPARITAPTRQPYNAMAKDTTPFNCEQYRHHPHPGMAGYCQSIEAMALQNEAHRQGRPAPSASVIRLPGLGSAEAKQLGLACVGGQVLKRLPNGWAQVSAAAGGWQRCQGG